MINYKASIIALSVLLVSGLGFAQQNSSLPMPPNYNTGPTMTGSLSLSPSSTFSASGYTGESDSVGLDSSIGFGFGAQKINLSSLGYSTSLNYQSYKASGAKLSNLGIEVSGTYGLNMKSYVFAGLNMSNLEIESEGSSLDLDSSFGYQLGFGYRASSNLVVELMQQQIAASFLGLVDLEISGLSIRTKLMF